MVETLGGVPQAEVPQEESNKTNVEAEVPEYTPPTPPRDEEAQTVAGEAAYQRTMNTINASAESRKIASEAEQEAEKMSAAASEAVKPPIPEIKSRIDANPIPGSTIEPANDAENMMTQSQMNRADREEAKKKPWWKFWVKG